MKKIFFFAAAMMAAISINAETVFDWAGNVGTTTMFGTTAAETVKVKGTATNCLSLKNAFKDNNGVKIEAASGAFQVGDILNVEFCLNNSDASKTAILGVYAADSTELTYAAANNTYSTDADASTLQYALTAEQSVLLLGRKSGNTKCCITKLEVIRGGEVVIEAKAAKPIFSVASGNYFDPFKVAIESSKADKIFYSINSAEYVEYTDVVNGKGYPKMIVPAFTTDALILERAEAYALKSDYTKAYDDLTAWMNAFTKNQSVLTATQLAATYGSSKAYYTPTAPTTKKKLNPDFTVTAGEQENLIHAILHARRVTTLHEGLRWFDIKRYGIEIYRRSVDGILGDGNISVYDTMPKDDPRRAIQLPTYVINAGIQANPR